jgi:Secretion system C-terminal sorting domain/Pregnancy-associated plasma protein-A
MKKFLFLLLFYFCGFNAFSQLNCLTVTSGPDYLAGLPQNFSIASGPYTVRVFAHAMRGANCTGGITDGEITEALNILKNDFEPYGICFSLAGKDEICGYTNDMNALVQDAHNNLVSNTPNAIDIYFMPRSFGANGGIAYAAPSKFMALGGEFTISPSTHVFYSALSHSITHEMGHCLGLYHTFHSNTTTNTIPPDCIENIARTGPNKNCDICGDYLCDTEADPNVAGTSHFDFTTCVYTNAFPFETDLTGNTNYIPDTHNFMSYALENCYSQFSNGQAQRMINFISSHPILQPVTVPKEVYVQNITKDNGVFLYAANDKVIAGNNVTTGALGDVLVIDNAVGEMMAVNEVSLQPGFQTSLLPGGAFKASINRNFCSVVNQINSARVQPAAYIPMLQNTKWWLNRVHPIEGTESLLLYQSTDTIIDAHTYSKIKLMIGPFFSYWISPPPPNFVLYWREDTLSKTVYEYNAAAQQEDLIYDFSLNVGDSFPSTIQAFHNYTVITKDTVNFLGVDRTRLIFTNNVIWIEGIGNINHPYMPYIAFFNTGNWLVCAYQNNNTIYDDGATQGLNCNLITGLNTIENNGSFSVKLNNLFSEKITCKIELQNPEQLDFSISDMAGREVKKTSKHFDNLKSDFLLDLNKLKSGIYILRIANKATSLTFKIAKF